MCSYLSEHWRNGTAQSLQSLEPCTSEVMMALYENDYIIVIRVIYGTVLYVVTHTPEIGCIAKKGHT